MFWKKMKQTIDPQKIDPKETDSKEMRENEDQREAFRYLFKGDRRLSMDFKRQPVKVLNISAGGMAFRGDGFTRYDVDQIRLFLEIPNYRGEIRFSAQLRILDITDKGICHCIFENCTIEEYEIIHKYVLEMQKNDIKTNAKNQMTQNRITKNSIK